MVTLILWAWVVLALILYSLFAVTILIRTNNWLARIGLPLLFGGLLGVDGVGGHGFIPAPPFFIWILTGGSEMHFMMWGAAVIVLFVYGELAKYLVHRMVTKKAMPDTKAS